VRLTLEQALADIEDDELVEVTLRSVRLRKRQLDPSERRKEAKRGAAA
jgi:GTP-binding protein